MKFILLKSIAYEQYNSYFLTNANENDTHIIHSLIYDMFCYHLQHFSHHFSSS